MLYVNCRILRRFMNEGTLISQFFLTVNYLLVTLIQVNKQSTELKAKPNKAQLQLMHRTIFTIKYNS